MRSSDREIDADNYDEAHEITDEGTGGSKASYKELKDYSATKSSDPGMLKLQLFHFV